MWFFKLGIYKIYINQHLISKNNRFAATLNFKKLETCRPGYGYSFSQQNFKDDENFLYIWDLKTNEIL